MGLKYHNGPHPIPVAERFWSKVEQSDGCWLWQAARDGQGYGRIGSNRTRPLRAHRLAYEFTFGPIPEGMDVLHQCDNPPCVRPDHLRVGTHEDNVRDMYEKRRHTKGEDSHFAKVTGADVRAMREAWESGRSSVRNLAAQYGLSPSGVRQIVYRRKWKHIA